MDFAAACAGARRDVFGTELLVETRLEGGDLTGGIGVWRWISGEEWVDSSGCVAVLVTWSGGLSVACSTDAVGVLTTYRGIVNHRFGYYWLAPGQAVASSIEAWWLYRWRGWSVGGK